MPRTLNDYSKEELIAKIKDLQSTKQFGLVWENKTEDIVEQLKNNIPLLNEIQDKALTSDSEPTHLIIEGDNYHSLHTLNYSHAGKVDIIYIDPPYNTGNKDFTYNDHYVDSEDSFRHSKWLSFMKRRLELAKNLLKEDGVIFISLDDNEIAHLRILCDGIFGENNFIQNFLWLHGKGKKDRWSRTMQQYILCYAKSKEKVANWNILNTASYNFQNPDNDERGSWFSGSVSFSEARSKKSHKNYFSITSPSGITWTRQWFKTQSEMQELIDSNKIFFGPKPKYDAVPRLKIFPGDVSAQIPPNLIDDAASTRDAQNELRTIMGDDVFDYPKPTSLIKKLLTFSSHKDAVILDFFAGSGTTGHAVLELNKEDGGNRQFILCTNNENNIAENITYVRIKKVIEGYDKNQGIPTNLRYFKTELVPKLASVDATRSVLARQCNDLVRIRENAFNTKEASDSYYFYESPDNFVAIILDSLNLQNIWSKLEASNTKAKPVKVYVFSYSQYAFSDTIPETHLSFETYPIPEGILEVYKKLQRLVANERANDD